MFVLQRKLFHNTRFFYYQRFFHDTHREKLCYIQFSIRMAGWLLLTIFICLRNQLSSIILSITRIKSTDV